jgi:hypothetical protein
MIAFFVLWNRVGIISATGERDQASSTKSCCACQREYYSDLLSTIERSFLEDFDTAKLLWVVT